MAETEQGNAVRCECLDHDCPNTALANISPAYCVACLFGCAP